MKGTGNKKKKKIWWKWELRGNWREWKYREGGRIGGGGLKTEKWDKANENEREVGVGGK